MAEDPREAAERYRFEKWQREQGLEPESDSEPRPAAARPVGRRACRVRRGVDPAGDAPRGVRPLPGAGKPLEGLGESHDPDWWIRRKIEREQLRGLGPPALMLRVEHAELEERLDALTREDEVREYIDDFNRRVIEARRQLLGGPPVVTPTRDADAEVRAWHERRAARRRAEAEAGLRRPRPPPSASSAVAPQGLGEPASQARAAARSARSGHRQPAREDRVRDLVGGLGDVEHQAGFVRLERLEGRQLRVE